MHKYGVIIYWSDEDQVFIAEAPELPGCITHGDTQGQALANANEAIQLWIDTAKEFDNPVPKPKGGRLVSNSPAKLGYKIETSKRRLSALRNNPRISAPPRAPQPTVNPEARLN